MDPTAIWRAAFVGVRKIQILEFTAERTQFHRVSGIPKMMIKRPKTPQRHRDYEDVKASKLWGEQIWAQ